MSATHYKQCHFACLQCLYLFNACGFLGAAAFLGELRVPSVRADAREQRDAVDVVHQLADAAPGAGCDALQEARDVHLHEDTGHATVLCEMISKVVLCPLGNEVCEETTNVVVEPGYHYTFSIYSSPTSERITHPLAVLTNSIPRSRPPGSLPSASRSPSTRLKPEERFKRLTITDCAKNCQILQSVSLCSWYAIFNPSVSCTCSCASKSVS